MFYNALYFIQQPRLTYSNINILELFHKVNSHLISADVVRKVLVGVRRTSQELHTNTMHDVVNNNAVKTSVLSLASVLAEGSPKTASSSLALNERSKPLPQSKTSYKFNS